MKRKFSASRFVIILVLAVGGLSMLIPFVWMILCSFKPAVELLKMPPTILPKKGLWMGNYKGVLELIPFGRYILNSIGLGVVNTAVGILTSTLSGYIFAKYNFRFRNVLFILLLGSMMIPFQVIMIPMYSMMVDLGWVNSYFALTVPYFYSIFGIFLMRQFIVKLPNELMEAAKMDGCSHSGTFFRIIMPLVSSAIAALTIFLFMMSWNDYLWPLIVIDSDAYRTIPLGLAAFVLQRSMKYDLLMAASVMAVLPILVVFLFAQKRFIDGIALTGLKS